MKETTVLKCVRKGYFIILNHYIQDMPHLPLHFLCYSTVNVYCVYVCVCVLYRALPSPSIPTPTAQEMQDIVEYVVAGRDTLNLEQVRQRWSLADVC